MARTPKRLGYRENIILALENYPVNRASIKEGLQRRTAISIRGLTLLRDLSRSRMMSRKPFNTPMRDARKKSMD
jgi:hypothetical protein